MVHILNLVQKLKNRKEFEEYNFIGKFDNLMEQEINLEEFYEKSLLEIEHVLNTDSDVLLREEILCDFYAFKEAFSYISQIFPKIAKEDILDFLQIAAKLCHSLLGTLTAIESELLLVSKLVLEKRPNHGFEEIGKLINKNVNLFIQNNNYAINMRINIIADCFAIECFDKFRISGAFSDPFFTPEVIKKLEKLYNEFRPSNKDFFEIIE